MVAFSTVFSNWAAAVLLSKLLLFSSLCFPVSAKGTLIFLTEDTWEQLLEGEWMVEFYAPWCPACKTLEATWKEFANWSDDLGIKVAHVDVTANPGLSGRFIVTALPTIYHVKDGIFRQYTGARDKDAFFSFIEEKKWSHVEPLSKWKKPQSFQMSAVSHFFKLSMTLRGVHNKLVEEYGLPYWASYILFGLATVIVGAFLGLIIVCMIDLFFPAKPPMISQYSSKEDETNMLDQQKSEAEEEDVILDDHEQDNLRNEIKKRNVVPLAVAAAAAAAPEAVPEMGNE